LIRIRIPAPGFLHGGLIGLKWPLKDKKKSVLGIRDIFGADPDPDQTPDPTTFFIDFKDAKKIFFLNIFSYNFSRGTSSSD
jgi:hypothetical protein